MANPENLDLTEDRVFPLGWGFIFRAVCAPKSWAPERVAAQVTSDDPPGTSNNKWVISEPEERPADPETGEPDAFNGTNCIPCPDDKNRQHWLLNC